MEHMATSSFVGDRDGLTPRGASRDGTEIGRTITDGVGSEDKIVDIEGANSPSTSSDAEDEMATSFPGGLTTLELLPSFCHHVLLDIWRNKVTRVNDEDEAYNRRALDIALRFRSMPKTNVVAENAITMADAVIAFLSGVEEE
ncbi:hypothetical protein Syun_023792 [Stephania yunnanensis]|uniref:Uncharacterized protein n=1 Tax=Stephania yunnanensis TaxID=152371 RepID=A0AAP0F9N4_9MAGN